LPGDFKWKNAAKKPSHFQRLIRSTCLPETRKLSTGGRGAPRTEVSDIMAVLSWKTSQIDAPFQAGKGEIGVLSIGGKY